MAFFIACKLFFPKVKGKTSIVKGSFPIAVVWKSILYNLFHSLYNMYYKKKCHLAMKWFKNVDFCHLMTKYLY